MLKKTLQCLEGIHLSQSGSLLMLYVDKLLSTPFRVLARMVDTLACRRVEMLLAETLQVPATAGDSASYMNVMVVSLKLSFVILSSYPAEQRSSAACGGAGQDPGVPPDQRPGTEVSSSSL